MGWRIMCHFYIHCAHTYTYTHVQCGHQPCVRVWDISSASSPLQVAEMKGHNYGVTSLVSCYSMPLGCYGDLALDVVTSSLIVLFVWAGSCVNHWKSGICTVCLCVCECVCECACVCVGMCVCLFKYNVYVCVCNVLCLYVCMGEGV